MPQGNKPFENTVGKGEIARNEIARNLGNKLVLWTNKTYTGIFTGRILPGLLGDFTLSETVQQIMGVCPHVFRNKVKGQQSLGRI